MNKFLICRTSVLVLSILLLTTRPGLAQGVQYLQPFAFTPDQNSAVQIAGKIKQHYLLYYSPAFSIPEIQYYNENGELVLTRPLNFIKPGITTNVNLVCGKELIHLVVQEVRANIHYTYVASFDGDGNEISQPAYIDSTRFDRYGNSAFYHVLGSPDKSHVLLYRIVHGFSNFQVLFDGLLLDATGRKKGLVSFYFALNDELERIGNVFLTNHGHAFLPVFDKADNYRIGTSLRLYQLLFNDAAPRLTELYIKEKKPTDLVMDWCESKKQLVLGGIYYDFYRRRIDGAIAIMVTPGINKPDTIIAFDLDKDFKKKLRRRIYNMSTTDAVNALQIRYLKVSDKGEIVLLADMFTNSAFGQRPLGSSTFGQNRLTNPGALTTPNYSPTSTMRNVQERQFSMGRIRNSNNTPNLAPSTLPQIFMENEMKRMNQNYQLRDLTTNNDILAFTKTLDYKSVIFSIDSSKKQSWMNCTNNLYVPGTPFNNVFIMPLQHTLGVLSYEVNGKSSPYLLSQVFEPAKVISQTLVKPGNPMLFYKRNAVMVEANAYLTIYNDSHANKMGLALISW